MKIAVIIVNFNDCDDTINYVKILSEYEVIDRIVVVDNQSTKTNEMEQLSKLASEKVWVIASDKNGGYNYGNNFGIRYLEEKGEKFDYFLISNPDIEVEEKAIKECIQFLEKDTEIAIAAPRMVNGERKTSS